MLDGMREIHLTKSDAIHRKIVGYLRRTVSKSYFFKMPV